MLGPFRNSDNDLGHSGILYNGRGQWYVYVQGFGQNDFFSVRIGAKGQNV